MQVGLIVCWGLLSASKMVSWHWTFWNEGSTASLPGRKQKSKLNECCMKPFHKDLNLVHWGESPWHNHLLKGPPLNTITWPHLNFEGTRSNHSNLWPSCQCLGLDRAQVAAKEHRWGQYGRCRADKGRDFGGNLQRGGWMSSAPE